MLSRQNPKQYVENYDIQPTYFTQVLFIAVYTARNWGFNKYFFIKCDQISVYSFLEQL